MTTPDRRVWMLGLLGERIDSGFTVRDDVPPPMLAVEVHGIKPGTVIFAPLKSDPSVWRVGVYAYPEREPRRIEEPKFVHDGDGGHHEVQIIRSSSHPDEHRLTLCVAGLATSPSTSADAAAACPYCQHPLTHHDQPDCWDCTNAGTVCDSEEAGRV